MNRPLLSLFTTTCLTLSTAALPAQTSMEMRLTDLNITNLDEDGGADEPLVLLLGFRMDYVRNTTGIALSRFDVFTSWDNFVDPNYPLQTVTPDWGAGGLGWRRIPRHIGTLRWSGLQTGALPSVIGWVTLVLEEDWMMSRAQVHTAMQDMRGRLRTAMLPLASSFGAMVETWSTSPNLAETFRAFFRLRLTEDVTQSLTSLLQGLPWYVTDPHDLLGVDSDVAFAGRTWSTRDVYSDLSTWNGSAEQTRYHLWGKLAPPITGMPILQAPLVQNGYMTSYWNLLRFGATATVNADALAILSRSSAARYLNTATQMLGLGLPVTILFSEDNYQGDAHLFVGAIAAPGRSHLDWFQRQWNQDSTNSILFLDPGQRSQRLNLFTDPNYSGPYVRIVGTSALPSLNRELKDKFNLVFGNNAISSFSVVRNCSCGTRS